MSLDVVRTLLDNFVEGTLSGNRTGANEAQSFLVRQIADLEKRLSEAEARLAEFRKRNVGMLPGESRGDYFSRLEAEMTCVAAGGDQPGGGVEPTRGTAAAACRGAPVRTGYGGQWRRNGVGRRSGCLHPRAGGRGASRGTAAALHG
jgi:hypothetical protein